MVLEMTQNLNSEQLTHLNPERDQRWMRVPDVVAYTGLSKSKLAADRLAGMGMPFVKAGRIVLYDRADVDEYLSSRKIGSKP